MESADRHHLAWRADRAQSGGASLGRDHAPRHHRRPLRAQGDRERRRRLDRGRGGRRRPCRPLVAVRAAPGNPDVVRRPADPLRRIANGGSVLAAQAAGADLAYVGSPFIATEEATTPPSTISRRSSTAAPRTSSPPSSPAFTAIICDIVDRQFRLDPDNLAKGRYRAHEVRLEGFEQVESMARYWGLGQGIGVIDRAARPIYRSAGRSYMRSEARLCA